MEVGSDNTTPINLWRNIRIRCCNLFVRQQFIIHMPRDNKQFGSGFIVNINGGLVLTNAHVVSNADSISGRIVIFVEKDLPLKLISIRKEKVASC